MKIIPFSSRGFDSSMYLIIGKINTLVDTGTGANSDSTLKDLERYLDKGKLDQILLTHEHIDHIGGVGPISKATGALVMGSDQTCRILSKGDSVMSGALLFGRGLDPVKNVKQLSDGDTVILGDMEFRVMETPGHSQGSLCFFEGTEKTLFSGDTIFTHGGVGRWDLPGGDQDQLLESIKKISQLHVKGLYPGHGGPVEKDGHEHILMGLEYLKSF